MSRALRWLAFLCILAAPLPAAQNEIPYEWSDVPRIVAVGDVHGAYENLVSLLQNADLVDEKLRWIGGRAHLVQTGDLVDRGARSRDVMDLLMRLEKEAEEAGGRVHALIGNHDAFNAIGVLDYVAPEEFASYATEDSENLRERFFQRYYTQEVEKARAEGKEPPPEAEERSRFEERHPLGYVEHRLAFAPQGTYGAWVRRRNAAVRLNGIVFSHADWSEEHARLGLAAVNRGVREELAGLRALEGGILLDPEGPLQNRALSKVELTREAQQAQSALVESIFEHLQASRMVVGHTVTETGTIEPRFGGKHVSVDVGMLELYAGGHRAALEIEGSALRAIHPRGKVELPAYLDETSLLPYLEAVARVDPGNPNVSLHLAQSYYRLGRLAEARDAYESLFRSQPPPNLQHLRALGDIYRELGQSAKAREQYAAYLDGLGKLVRASPENAALKNFFARFALEHDLRLDEARRLLEEALAAKPNSPQLLLTFARLEGRRDPPGALRVLERVQDMDPTLEVWLQLGLAYQELGATDRARRALERALELDPKNEQAREMLDKLRTN